MVTKLQLVVGGATVLVAFLLVAVVACDGGGGEADVTPTPGTTEVETQLREMVLQLKDLPSGVILAEEFLVTAEESAAGSDDRAERLAKLNEWGYILGYEVTYQPNTAVMTQTGLMLANSTSSLYDSEEGAEASFADAVETARATDWAELWGGTQELKVEELALPPVVDEGLWLRITAEAAPEVGIGEETFAQDVVLFRQGSGRGNLMVAWTMESGSSDFVLSLIQAQAQHLKETLP
ncbi:MAG: hypothetical protein AMJ76_01870 [Dehalococcoidia bacterium SM23_28_1]|nr:MAG: hypothetical protein AMJ76_01870 [Dehalococcoidia bacterium SM23_28_1]